MSSNNYFKSEKRVKYFIYGNQKEYLAAIIIILWVISSLKRKKCCYIHGRINSRRHDIYTLKNRDPEYVNIDRSILVLETAIYFQ